MKKKLWECKAKSKSVLSAASRGAWCVLCLAAPLPLSLPADFPVAEFPLFCIMHADVFYLYARTLCAIIPTYFRITLQAQSQQDFRERSLSLPIAGTTVS